MEAAASGSSILQALAKADEGELKPSSRDLAGAARLGWKVAGLGLILAAALAWTQWRTTAQDSPALRASPAAQATVEPPNGVHAAALPPATASNQPMPASRALAASSGGLPAGLGVLADAASRDPGREWPAPSSAANISRPEGQEAISSGAPASQAPGLTPAEQATAGRVTAAASGRPAASAEDSPARPAKERRTATAPTVSRPGASPAPRTPVATSHPHDTDVDIISALMRSSSAGSAPQSPGATAAAASAKSESIASLVNSCSSHSGQEVLACKARICKGYWGKAEACPKRERKAAEKAAHALQGRGAT